MKARGIITYYYMYRDASVYIGSWVIASRRFVSKFRLTFLSIHMYVLNKNFRWELIVCKSIVFQFANRTEVRLVRVSSYAAGAIRLT